uniref:Fucosyltransferase n=1 Tax=Meloidogyne enterolobii TaxID=390850 RepID=A0A6V7V0S8_MELEN|nr:unnamed protein product [Meloidogyne enterolobii]
MTYRVDSDIYYPYDTFIPCNGKCHVDEFWSEKEVLEKVRRKSKLAMKAFSDCSTPSKRENLIAELGRLIKIDLYGNCPGNTKCDFEYCLNQELGEMIINLVYVPLNAHKIDPDGNLTVLLILGLFISN